MADHVCARCGLPKELCVCAELAEKPRLRVRVDARRYGKAVTLVEGFGKEDDLSVLAKRLKSALATGGTAKDGHVELQGDHRKRVRSILEAGGYGVDD
ncbi:MAG: stress response translation initiation inhibitor YciH [Methanobacteriota archaeon]